MSLRSFNPSVAFPLTMSLLTPRSGNFSQSAITFQFVTPECNLVWIFGARLISEDFPSSMWKVSMNLCFSCDDKFSFNTFSTFLNFSFGKWTLFIFLSRSLWKTFSTFSFSYLSAFNVIFINSFVSELVTCRYFSDLNFFFWCFYRRTNLWYK